MKNSSMKKQMENIEIVCKLENRNHVPCVALYRHNDESYEGYYGVMDPILFGFLFGDYPVTGKPLILTIPHPCGEIRKM